MADGRLIPDGAVIVCMDCDWSSPDLRARHECPNGRKALQAKLELAEMERDEANGALSETLDMLADAHARMLIPICVHCGTKPGAAAKATHWRECPTHPARAALAAAESALAAAQGALREARDHAWKAGCRGYLGDDFFAKIDAAIAGEPRAAPPALAAELSGKGEQDADRIAELGLTPCPHAEGSGEEWPMLECELCVGEFVARVRAEERAEPGEAKKEPR